MLETLQHLRSTSLHYKEPQLSFTIDEAEDYIQQSARLLALIDTLDEISRKNEKVLIFLESRSMQSFLQMYLKRRYQLEEEPFLINGSMSNKLRQKQLDAFKKIPENQFHIFILAPKAAGFGLNLVEANHVIHLSRWWNPAVEDQCTDRSYRIKQDKDVHIYLPLAIYPDDKEASFDTKLNQLMAKKRQLSKNTLLPIGDYGDSGKDLYGSIFGKSAPEYPDFSLSHIDKSGPTQFEDWCLAQLKKRYWHIQRTHLSGDAGADGVAHKENEASIIIQCKHTSDPTSSCTQNVVAELLNARESYTYVSPVLVAITNAKSFSQNTLNNAKKERVCLISRDQLEAWYKSPESLFKCL